MIIDIICPVYNGEKCIINLNESIKMQKNVQINSIKYILTDSKDNTEEILKVNKIEYQKIEKNTFSHSKTREMVARNCDADIIVFITQDIIIEDENWLYNLTKGIINGECDAAYSRQISKSDGIEKYTREKNYPEESKIVTKANIEEMGLKTFFFSDASSAIKNETFKKLNYYDGKHLSTNEDMYIAYKLIMNGYKIKYEAESVIVHSHNLSFRELYKRYYDTGVFFKENNYLDQYGTNKAGGGMAKYVLNRIVKERDLKAFKRFFPDMLARYLGMTNGKNNVNKRDFYYVIIGIVIFLITIVFYYLNLNYFSALVLIISSIALFFLNKKQYGYYTNPKGIFSGVYLFTIGLATLRLHNAQVQWKFETWICIICGFLAFDIGYIINKEKRKLNNKNNMSKKLSFILIFLISTASIVAFIVEIMIRGYLPMFSDDMAAYQKFSVTGIHYFTVSCALILPLSILYYCIYKKEIKTWEKIYLIIINIIALTVPFLIVSRQLMITTIVLGAFSYIEVNYKKEVITIIVALLLVGMSWKMIGNYRNQNNEYLKQALEINTENEVAKENEIENIIDITSHDINKKEKRITIKSTKIMQIYMYLAMNYDNFDYNVGELENYYWGSKSLFPVFALSGMKFIFPYFSDLRFRCKKNSGSI